MSIPKEDERTPGPSMRDQVADQCKVVAALADIVAKVNTDYERLLRDPESGPKMEDILDIVGNRTAQLMEYLGDVLNGMDACDEEDEWMTPIFQGAHKMFQVGPETGSFNSLREALAEGRQAAVNLASMMREGGHDKEEIKWCKVVDNIDAALIGVTQPAKRYPEETGWLVEMNDAGPKYYSFAESDPDDPWGGFQREASKATRFARKEDAEALIAAFAWTPGHVYASEHVWGGEKVSQPSTEVEKISTDTGVR